ncbi:MAG: dihydroxy-acid dehydratase [Alphaproteobacteria bacterium]|nr:dihydroxy-acid dehydratase [Alphaproteobacteria bacterium]
MSSLRSARWFEAATRMGHTHRQRIMQGGFARADFAGKPVVAILSTWSDLNPCHGHFRERADDVKRGVWEAGGFPVEIPVMALGEPFVKPTAMLYRSLLAIQTEESLRCHPVDGAVLMGGCDKTTPGLILGAISMNLPAIFLPAGPMLTGRWRNQALGSGTDTAKAFMDWKAGVLPDAEFREMEEAGARSPGHCMTMGTASTMTALAETMGLTLPGASSIPAPDSRHRHMAVATGRRAVEMIAADLRPRAVLSDASFHNAIVALMALGGSTNAVIHLVAMARRLGLALPLDRFDSLSRRVPVLADLRPSGRYLMEDFFEAGGLRGLLSRLGDLLDGGARTVSGRTLAEDIAGAKVWSDEVIRTRADPIKATGGLAILRGNLAPDGAVLKSSAATPGLLRHRGRAIVFEGWADFAARVDSADLDVDETCVMVLRNCGPRGTPGMPEWGMMQVPKKLLDRGVRDIVRVSDARMSGTHFGTVVLHVAPEAALGGPLALVRDGDIIELDAEGRSLDLVVPEAELARRKAAWRPQSSRHGRGWAKLYADHVEQADRGADLDVLGPTGESPEPEIN